MNVLDIMFRPKKISQLQAYKEAASTIEAFIAGSCGPWDWDDFTSLITKDAFLDSVRQQCVDVYDNYPAGERGRYCSDEGLDVLRSIVRELRARIPEMDQKTIPN